MRKMTTPDEDPKGFNPKILKQLEHLATISSGAEKVWKRPQRSLANHARAAGHYADLTPIESETSEEPEVIADKSRNSPNDARTGAKTETGPRSDSDEEKGS